VKSWISVALASLALGLACLCVWRLETNARETTPPERSELQRTRDSLELLKTSVEQQTAVLHRALGKQIPIELPNSQLQKLERLEGALRSKSAWPDSVKGVEKLRQELTQFVKEIPPWAEEDLLPRLNSLRWGIEALWTVLASENTPADEVESTCRSLLGSMPENSSNELRELLTRKLEAATQAAEKKRQADLVRIAEAALKGTGDPAAAWDSLKVFESQPEVKSLRNQLRARILDDAVRNRLTLLKETHKQSTTGGNEKLRQAALLRAYEGAIGLLLDFGTEEPRPEVALKEVREFHDVCERELNEDARRQQDEVSIKVRAYQAWALKQIQSFSAPNGWHYEATLKWIHDELKSFKDATEDRDWVLFKSFPSTKELFQEKLGIDMSDVPGASLTVDKQKEIYAKASKTIGWRNDIDQEVAYRTTRDGMVAYLLPINVNLLDPPVAQLYQRAFNKGWEKLNDREDQLYVAQQSAVVRKEELDSMAVKK